MSATEGHVCLIFQLFCSDKCFFCSPIPTTVQEGAKLCWWGAERAWEDSRGARASPPAGWIPWGASGQLQCEHLHPSHTDLPPGAGTPHHKGKFSSTEGCQAVGFAPNPVLCNAARPELHVQSSSHTFPYLSLPACSSPASSSAHPVSVHRVTQRTTVPGPSSRTQHLLPMAMPEMEA